MDSECERMSSEEEVVAYTSLMWSTTSLSSETDSDQDLSDEVQNFSCYKLLVAMKNNNVELKSLQDEYTRRREAYKEQVNHLQETISGQRETLDN